MGRLSPINRRLFTSPNVGRSPALSSERCEEAVGGGQIARARRLRKSATEAEQSLWHALRLLKPPIGPYFPDFVCHRSKLVVEIDGSHHAEEAAVEYDAVRTKFLNSQGHRVLQFWNFLEGVIDDIVTAAKSPPPARLRRATSPRRGR